MLLDQKFTVTNFWSFVGLIGLRGNNPGLMHLDGFCAFWNAQRDPTVRRR